MPYYEYHCPENGRTVEVRHAMSELLDTWGDLSTRAEVDPGATPPDAAVVRLRGAPVALTSAGGPDASPPSCGPGCACAAEA